jgi:hypothetical protein
MRTGTTEFTSLGTLVSRRRCLDDNGRIDYFCCEIPAGVGKESTFSLSIAWAKYAIHFSVNVEYPREATRRHPRSAVHLTRYALLEAWLGQIDGTRDACKGSAGAG